MRSSVGSHWILLRRTLALSLASLLLAGAPGSLPALGMPSPSASEATEAIEIEASPLFAHSLRRTVAVLDGEERTEKVKPAAEGAEEPQAQFAPLAITTDFTCYATCGTTCNTTCVGSYTCASTCNYTCMFTCDDYTCGATCSSTCIGSVTCSTTCVGSYTCYSTCSGTTCSSTCGTTCTGTTCTTTCGTTCTGSTCDGTTCDGATCDATCEGVTCGATCGADCDPSAIPVFSDGFETWPGPWSPSSVSDPTWGSTTHRASEGSKSAYCAGSTIAAPGPYANDMEAWLTAGPFDLSGYSQPTLVFDLWLDSEDGWDSLWAGASLDGTNYSVAGWSGDSGGWMTVEVGLDDYAGESDVWVGFVFESDSSVTYEGAYVDDVRLMGIQETALDDGCDRVDGSTRYETSIDASVQGFPTGASTVVIATGTNWPDALGGSALAGAVSGPLLLTDPNILRDDVSQEIQRLGATGAYILGGTGAVSPAVETALRSLLSNNVKRLQGATRYETAARVAEETIAILGDRYTGAIFVATGANFPDATAAAPLAAGLQRPILLSNPNAAFAQAVLLPPEATSAYILGGTGAVSSGVASALSSELSGSVTRLSGATRYETAVRIAEHGVAEGLHWNGVGIATGENFPDALSGGAMLGRIRSVMLLTLPTSLPTITRDTLQGNAGAIDALFIFGGTGAVSSSVEVAAKSAAGVP